MYVSHKISNQTFESNVSPPQDDGTGDLDWVRQCWFIVLTFVVCCSGDARKRTLGLRSIGARLLSDFGMLWRRQPAVEQPYHCWNRPDSACRSFPPVSPMQEAPIRPSKGANGWPPYITMQDHHCRHYSTYHGVLPTNTPYRPNALRSTKHDDNGVERLAPRPRQITVSRLGPMKRAS